MSHKWRAVADTLAAAMQHHSQKGVCTLTENEHAALVVYVEARRSPGPLTARSLLGVTGGTEAFSHDDHDGDPQFVLSSPDHEPAGTWVEECPTCRSELVMTENGRIA